MKLVDEGREPVAREETRIEGKDESLQKHSHRIGDGPVSHA